MGLSRPGRATAAQGAASLGLLRALPGDRFALDDLGAAMLGNPAIAAFVAHHDLLYADLADPVRAAARRSGDEAVALLALCGQSAVGDRGERRAGDGRRALRRLQRADVAHAGAGRGRRSSTPIRSRGIGGSSMSAAATAPFSPPRRERAPRLALDAVRSSAGRRRARGEASRRSASRPRRGDRRRLPARPAARRAPTSSRWCACCTTTTTNRRASLLAAVRDALPRGGVVVVAEPMAGARGAEPMGDAYFGFYLLAMGRGRPRTRAARSPAS